MLGSRTIDSYKVVYVDSTGTIVEHDTNDETEARTFASAHTPSKIFRIRMIGGIEELI